MSAPSCCYYISGTTLIPAIYGILQTDQWRTEFNRPVLASIFAANGDFLENAINQLTSSGNTDTTLIGGYITAIAADISASGTFSNRGLIGALSAQIYIGYGTTAVIGTNVANDIKQTFEVITYFERFEPTHPFRNDPNPVLHIGIRILIAGYSGYTLHLVVPATKNEGYIPCPPTPTIPPTDECNIPCEDDDDYDDCDEDEECVNKFVRSAPSQFYGGVYRFA